MNVEDGNNQQNQTQPAADKSAQSSAASQAPPQTDTQPTKPDSTPNKQVANQPKQESVTVPPAVSQPEPTPPQPKNTPAPPKPDQATDKKSKKKLTEEITPESFSGSGSAFGPPKSSVPPTGKPPAGKTGKASDTNEKKDPKKFKKSKDKKGNLIKYIIFAVLILILAGGVYYLVEMRKEPVPTAPVSIPEAEEVGPCTLEFDVPSPTPTPEPTYLSCGETGCDAENACDDGLVCISIEDIDGGVCAEAETATYDYPAACQAGFDSSDQEATYNACCTRPMCIEDVTIAYEELPGATREEDGLEFSATGLSDYTNIVLQLEYEGETSTAGSSNLMSLEPSTVQAAQTDTSTWIWDPVSLSITDLIAARIYVNVTNPEQPDETGELCGTLSPDVSPTPSATPSPTPEPGECGSENCAADTDCAGDLVCVTADDGSNYCAEEEYQDACIVDPGFDTCCTAPTSTPTATPTEEPTNTPPPDSTSTPEPTSIQTVDTSVDCNDACTTNADCDNISHICYNGRCRLDVNPEDEYCRTPQGETTVERIITPPVSGPQDWLNFLKIGIGAIGAGLLILLLI